MGKTPKRKIANFLAKQKLAIFMVPGAGIEPARIASLVFETSASTNSAIRALFISPVAKKADGSANIPIFLEYPKRTRGLHRKSAVS